MEISYTTDYKKTRPFEKKWTVCNLPITIHDIFLSPRLVVTPPPMRETVPCTSSLTAYDKNRPQKC